MLDNATETVLENYRPIARNHPNDWIPFYDWTKLLDETNNSIVHLERIRSRSTYCKFFLRISC